MRKKSKVDDNIEKYSVLRATMAIERSDVCLILIDAQEGVTEQDTKVAGLAHDAGKACIIVVNKWDLIEKDDKTMDRMREDIRRDLSYMPYAPILFISALTGQRVGRLFELINYVNDQAAMRITTGTLNSVLADAQTRVQPPTDKGAPPEDLLHDAGGRQAAPLRHLLQRQKALPLLLPALSGKPAAQRVRPGGHPHRADYPPEGRGRRLNHLIGATLLASLVILLLGYFLGCLNGSVMVSHFIIKDDVRQHGSGNAGLTNFYRTYGAKYALGVILFDMGKTVIACLIGGAAFDYLAGDWMLGVLLGGLGCELGHMFPVFFGFKGGKGILSGGTLVWLLDWRVGLIAWGLFAALWLLTKYVSLGSVCAAASMPVTTFFFCGRSLLYTALAVLIAALVIWCHRENITRLLHHQERKFQWHTGTPKEKE